MLLKRYLDADWVFRSCREGSCCLTDRRESDVLLSRNCPGWQPEVEDEEGHQQLHKKEALATVCSPPPRPSAACLTSTGELGRMMMRLAHSCRSTHSAKTQGTLLVVSCRRLRLSSSPCLEMQGLPWKSREGSEKSQRRGLASA